jgi:hypothetical protein
MFYRRAVVLAGIGLPFAMGIGATASMAQAIAHPPAVPAGAAQPAAVPPMAVQPAAVQPATAFSHWRVSFRSHQAFADVAISVAATGPGDAWAVVGPAQVARPSFLVHWNGHSWQRSHPLPAGFAPETVREPAPDDLWVFGQPSTASAKEALRWEGNQWHVVVVPHAAGINDPVVLGPDDVWVAGQSKRAAHGWTSAVWHWDGSRWADDPAPVGTGAAGGLPPIAGSSPSNLWLVSRAVVGKQKGQRLIAYRWTGTSWKWVSVPHPRLASLPTVAVTSVSSIWISAMGLPRPADRRPELVWHWNGRTLHATGPAPLSVSGRPAPDGLGGLWLGPLQYWTGTHWVRGHLPSCARGNFPAGDVIARIPGTHSALLAGTCNPGGANSPKAMVAVSKPAS